MTSESPKSLGIVKTLSSKPRLEALLLLFIYRKMSLTKLSKSLQKNKEYYDLSYGFAQKARIDQGI